MSPADRTEPQRRLRRVGIAPVIHRVAMRENGSQGPEAATPSIISEQVPQDLQSVLCEQDQNLVEFAMDTWRIESDDYEVDPSTESYTEDQMELDEQSSNVHNVSSPLDMAISIPRNVFTPVEILSFMFLNTCRETGSSVNDANEFYHFVNHALKELGGRGNINSNKAALALAKREISFSPVVEYETCSKGCYLFDEETDQGLLSCPVCNTERNASKKTYTKYVSIARKIAQLLAVDSKQDELTYRHREFENGMHDEGEYFDIFCGEMYKKMKQQEAFRLPLDQGVLLAVDGFTSRKSTKSMMIIHVILLNYEPTIRFENKNMFQAAVLCCDGKRDIKSFLRPVIKEFELFSKQPFRVLVDGREKALAHMHLLCITSDLVESNKLVDFGGHGSWFGCKYCLTKGEHPDEDGKGGMYYTLRNQPLRTVASLMLDEADFTGQENYGIRAPSIFGGLSSFTSPFFVALDEFHLASNVAKLLYEMLSPSFNEKYTYTGNEETYPFKIPSHAGMLIEKSLEVSKGHVSGFLGSWNPYNLRSKTKPSAYRSVCWLDVLRYTFPTLVAPFLSTDAAKALVAVVRGLSIMLQKNLDEDLIKEMEDNFEKWFVFLDRAIAAKKLSKTVYRINMHLLSHVGEYIRFLGPMPSTSARSMERSIGVLKRTMQASNNVATNNNNILETGALLDFLDFAGVVDFEAAKKKKQPPVFKNHPLDENLSQLWSPFFSDATYTLNNFESAASIKRVVSVEMLVDPLFHLNTRVTGDRHGGFLPHQFDYPITFSARLWHEDNVYKSDLHRACFNTAKKGYYAMFEVNQKTRQNTYKVVWYVCKIVCFFEFLLDKSPNGVPSHFVLGEVFESCSRQSISNMPEVKKLASSRKNLVAFDARDLVCPVSLLEEVKSVENGRVVVSPILKVIRNGPVFKKDMYKSAGDVSTLFLAL